MMDASNKSNTARNHGALLSMSPHVVSEQY
eukprot:COSAG01_NODE_13153_length_1627_cov_19.566754_1_plen_29_part_10